MSVCREKVSSAAADLKEALQGASQHGAGLHTALQQLAEALQPEEHLPALLNGKETCSCPCPSMQTQAARQLMTPACLCMLCRLRDALLGIIHKAHPKLVHPQCGVFHVTTRSSSEADLSCMQLQLRETLWHQCFKQSASRVASLRRACSCCKLSWGAVCRQGVPGRLRWPGRAPDRHSLQPMGSGRWLRCFPPAAVSLQQHGFMLMTLQPTAASAAACSLQLPAGAWAATCWAQEQLDSLKAGYTYREYADTPDVLPLQATGHWWKQQQ